MYTRSSAETRLFGGDGKDRTMRVPKRWRGLQARMALSYVAVTVVSVLVLELLAAGTFLTLFFTGDQLAHRVEATARQYAGDVSARVRGHAISADPTLILGDATARQGEITLSADGVTVPYIRTLAPGAGPLAFALLIAPDGRVVASSYPGGYPKGTRATAALPAGAPLVADALAGGTPPSEIADSSTGRIARATAPVWGVDKRPVGALYVQVAALPVVALSTLQAGLPLLGNGLILLLVAAPIGALFGLLTTRGLVRRLHRLAATTTAFASGDLSQRVPVGRNDEIGQLEDHVNRMADDLVTGIAQQRELAGRNSRLAERARLSRELHDSITQDLFSLNMLAGGMQAALPKDSPLRAHVGVMEETATRVLREMRALLLELRPVDLDHKGLAAALDGLAAAYRARLGLTVITHITPVTLTPPVEDALWRIAQEALSNAVRHADADAITLRLTPRRETVELTISDNDVGFRPDDATMGHGLGLRTIRERAEGLGGTLTLHSASGQGACLCVCLPTRAV